MDHQRLEDVQFEVSLTSTDSDSNVVPHYLATDHSHGLRLCWIDLAGHYTRARFVRGRESSPKPHRGPDPSHLTSLAIFINEAESVFKAPEAATMAS